MKKIKLLIRGVGNVKSLKNNKLMLLKQGRMITDPKAWVQQKMMVDKLERLLLLSVLGMKTDESTISTAQLRLSLTASPERAAELLTLLPADDEYLTIPELHLHGEYAGKGGGFVEITVEQLTD